MSAPDTGPRAPTALAGHHLRLFALIVDGLLAVVVTNLVAKLLLGADWDLRPPPAHGYAWLEVAAALLVLRDLPGARSPGKWFTGIQVARAADPATKPGLPALLVRNAALVLLPVEAVLVFTDRYYRRLGDHLAGTVVVATARPAPAARRLLGLAIIFLATLLGISLAEYWNVRRSAAYRVSMRAAAADPAVRAAFGDDVTFSAPGLALARDGRTLNATLSAESKQGEGGVEVFLRRAGPPPHWEVDRIDVHGPPSKEAKIEDAPTGPKQ